jgi:hypothetical protein
MRRLLAIGKAVHMAVNVKALKVHRSKAGHWAEGLEDEMLFSCDWDGCHVVVETRKGLNLHRTMVSHWREDVLTREHEPEYSVAAVNEIEKKTEEGEEVKSEGKDDWRFVCDWAYTPWSCCDKVFSTQALLRDHQMEAKHAPENLTF